jgi:hypothetical protein
MDGVIKCKYSEASLYDVYCCAVSFRDPVYGRWVVKPMDPGLPPYTKAEKKANAAFVKGYKGVFRKYRGGHRLRYGFEPIARMLIILDLVIMAFLYSADELQNTVVTVWSFLQFLLLIVVQPYNSFQKNFNAVFVALIKFFIFFINWLNKAVGRESKDVAGPFSDMCGPMMIMCMMAMVAANMALQLTPAVAPLMLAAKKGKELTQIGKILRWW